GMHAHSRHSPACLLPYLLSGTGNAQRLKYRELINASPTSNGTIFIPYGVQGIGQLLIAYFARYSH
ncbi:MAG: hypothetical protein M1396_01365, partial [Chloroflexi bacterium]|nr:hypothetical protein [Chloroflexota bacterium]